MIKVLKERKNMLGKEDRIIRVAVFCEIDDKKLFFAGDPAREEIELLQLQENKEEQYFYVEKGTLD